jgi:hypothetical protein
MKPEKALKSNPRSLDLRNLVGAARFELATPSPPDWCANRAALRSETGSPLMCAGLDVQANQMAGPQRSQAAPRLRMWRLPVVCINFRYIYPTSIYLVATTYISRINYSDIMHLQSLFIAMRLYFATEPNLFLRREGPALVMYQEVVPRRL